MHGNVRAVIRCKLFSEVINALRRLEVHVLPQDLGRTWTVSTSAVEIEITSRDYGELYVCPLVLAYLRPDSYHHHSRHPERAA
jgi:hypothetical protein